LAKIIKRGNLPKPKVFKHTCTNCNTVFECEGKELVNGSIPCPVCHTNCKIVPKVEFPNNYEGWIPPPYDKYRITNKPLTIG